MAPASLSSPYLGHPRRLADVIAAIQALGTYRHYKLDFAGWADRISGDPALADYWRKIFEDHPEFFRLDSRRERASLVWRRQHPKRFNVDTLCHISHEDFHALPDQGKQRVSRTPLNSGEISSLISAALSLYSQALESRQDSRWLVSVVVSGLIGLAGVILGRLLT